MDMLALRHSPLDRHKAACARATEALAGHLTNTIGTLERIAATLRDAAGGDAAADLTRLAAHVDGTIADLRRLDPANPPPAHVFDGLQARLALLQDMMQMTGRAIERHAAPL
jgi:hypothetical protein